MKPGAESVQPEKAESGTSRPALQRLLRPETIAIVGLSDASRLGRGVKSLLDCDAEVLFVNPNHPTVFGQPTAASLSAIGRPVDAVVSFLSAERTTDLVEEAVRLNVGGMVVIAGMFAEAGGEGVRLQERLSKAARAGGMALVGPNGLGYVNVRRRMSLGMSPLNDARPGGISIVAQSGAMMGGIATAARAYDGCGLNILVSSGNEAVTDLADYVDYFADDEETTCIGLSIETIRRPKAFFAAARKAADAGKPIVVLKLGRHDRSQKMALSHTAAVAGDAWVYDVALRQHGVALAYDPEELVDRLAIIGQTPKERWTAVENLAILTRSGGFAGLSYDIAQAEGLHVPPLDSFTGWMAEILPSGVTVPNPLDATSFGIPIWPKVLEKYSDSAETDAMLVFSPLVEQDAMTVSTLEQFKEMASAATKPCVTTNFVGGPAPWAVDLLGDVGALGHGLRSSLRGLQTMGAFVRYQQADRTPAADPSTVPVPKAEPIETAEGSLVPFAETMDLLAASGIPVAAYHIIPGGTDVADVRVPFAAPYVVKLADVVHRTERNAVRLQVPSAGLPDAVRELRGIAKADGLPATVAVQPMVEATDEVFVGLQGESHLGPLVVFGIGGIFVEALNRLGGRMAPLSLGDAHDLIDEFRDLGIMHGARGRVPWDLPALARILAAAGQLAAGASGWLGSLDINPLLMGRAGFTAVDAVLLLRKPAI